MSEIKFIREGRFVDPWGKDLGPVEPEKAPEPEKPEKASKPKKEG